MQNTPYQSDYHEYLENLKSNLDKSNSYVRTNQGVNSNYYPVQGLVKKNSTLKNSAIIIAILVAGISVVSFTTQGILLVFAEKKQPIDQSQTATTTDQIDQQKLYVRADLNKNIFSTTTEVVENEEDKNDKDITKFFNVNIPGVSRIGYDESLGNTFLTDNINKYSAHTLVIGDRGGTGDITIGGGDINDDLLIDKYDLVEKATLPVLSSKAYLMADLDTGEIIIDKNSDVVYPIASVSKLMTSVIATEKMNLQEVAIVSKDATNAYGAQGGLSLGEKIRLSDLIFPLLMESSNDAAEVFADHFGHQQFLDEMNKKAAYLNMSDTYYNDPSGLDPKNSSTPKDLLKLVRYIWKNDPTIFDTTRVKQFSIKGHTWLNRNAQLPLNGYIGGKNGFIDQALQTTASIFEIPAAKGGIRKVVIVILKSNDKNGDVIKLINFMKKSVVYTP